MLPLTSQVNDPLIQHYFNALSQIESLKNAMTDVTKDRNLWKRNCLTLNKKLKDLLIYTTSLQHLLNVANEKLAYHNIRNENTTNNGNNGACAVEPKFEENAKELMSHNQNQNCQTYQLTSCNNTQRLVRKCDPVPCASLQIPSIKLSQQRDLNSNEVIIDNPNNNVSIPSKQHQQNDQTMTYSQQIVSNEKLGNNLNNHTNQTVIDLSLARKKWNIYLFFCLCSGFK